MCECMLKCTLADNFVTNSRLLRKGTDLGFWKNTENNNQSLMLPKRENFPFADKLNLKLVYTERILPVKVKGLQSERICFVYSSDLANVPQLVCYTRRPCKLSSIITSPKTKTIL